MSDKKYLAFDFGAESGRAILGTLAEGKLTLEEKHRFANPMGRMNGQLQWNLLAQWEHVKQGLKNTRGIKLNGIGVDTWGVDFGLIDKAGNVLGNPVMYRDARTTGVIEQTFTRVPADEIYSATGIQLMEINTLYQLLAVARQNPDLIKAADKLLFMPDLFHYLLTGVAKSEFSIASTSQMYDPTRSRWATEMLEKLDLPTRLLCDVVPSGTVLGDVKPDVAAECGIGATPVIAPGGHDTASAVVSVPAQGENWCYISSGTWSLMGVELAKPLINEKTRKYNYTNEGGVGGTIRLLSNIMGLWLVQECRRDFAKHGYEHSYAELTQMAGNA
ncbi:MAG TPA: FGGY family carbohydrate kinase, partial [Tepidisphaeraceae bacterium]